MERQEDRSDVRVVREVRPQAEERLHVPAMGDQPRPGRDVGGAAGVAVDGDEMDGATDARDPLVGMDPRPELGHELTKAIVARERDLRESRQVPEERERLDVIVLVRGGMRGIRAPVVEHGHRHRSGRDPPRRPFEPGLDPRPRQAMRAIEVDGRPSPDLLDQGRRGSVARRPP